MLFRSKALERLVFGGESDVIEALKDDKTTEQEDYSSSDEVFILS